MHLLLRISGKGCCSVLAGGILTETIDFGDLSVNYNVFPVFTTRASVQTEINNIAACK